MGVALEELAGSGAAGHRRGRARYLAQVLDVLRRDLPRPSPRVLEVNRLLSASPVDLGKVAELVETEAELARAVWASCAGVSGAACWRGDSLDEAIVLLGIDRFKFVVSTACLRTQTGDSPCAGRLDEFWRHGFEVAWMSDRIGRGIAYFPREQPFLAGLFHDVGMLPLIEVTERAGKAASRLREALGDPAREQACFGLNHGAIGQWIGGAWDFPPAFIEAFAHHHDPGRALAAPRLARIVAAAATVAQLRDAAGRPGCSPDSPMERQALAALLAAHLPGLSGAEARALAEALEAEWNRPPFCFAPARELDGARAWA